MSYPNENRGHVWPSTRNGIKQLMTKMPLQLSISITSPLSTCFYFISSLLIAFATKMLLCIMS